MVDTIAGLSTAGPRVRHKQDVTLLCEEFPQRENGRMESIYLNERRPLIASLYGFPTQVFLCIYIIPMRYMFVGEMIVLQWVTWESVFGWKTSMEEACLGLRKETGGKRENKARRGGTGGGTGLPFVITK